MECRGREGQEVGNNEGKEESGESGGEVVMELGDNSRLRLNECCGLGCRE